MSAKLIRLESSDETIGGVLFTTPGGRQLVAHWQSKAPLSADDAMQLAKDCASHMLAHLIQKHHGAEVDAINWVSVTAASLAIVREWSERRKLALYSEGGGVVAGGARNG